MKFRLEREASGLGLQVVLEPKVVKSTEVRPGLKWELDSGAKGEIGLESGLESHL